MKKQRRTIFVTIILVMLLTAGAVLGGCGKKNEQQDGSGTPESESQAPEGKDDTQGNNAEISENAMQSFLDKLEGGDYVMDVTGVQKVTVYSEDLVFFDYADNDAYGDLAVMSVNNEVFQGFVEDGQIGNVSFLREGTAMEAAEKRLPNYWMSEEASEGNIYNLFYNDPDEPLKFVSYDPNVQDQLRTLVGYGNVAIKYMHEVYLTFDSEDPSEAHVTCVVDDDEVARYYFDDIDITITFGGAEADPAATAWMADPAYPDARTEWTEGDIFIFNSVFLPGYGEKAIPYIPSASYALQIDEERFLSEDAVFIRDPHATEEDVQAYADILKENGFEEVDEDGETFYRQLLREETKCYSSIHLEYNNGLDIEARKYYEFPEYEGIDSINESIVSNDYPALPETDDLTGFKATETKYEATEGWLYFYDYNTVLYVYADFEDQDAAMAYLDSYGEDIVNAGFTPVFIDDDENEGIDHYVSEDEARTFRYHFEDDDTVILLFKAEKLLTEPETQTILKNAGFPEIDADAFVSARDQTRFHKVMYGRNYDSATTVTMRFETQEEAEEFLDEYTGELEEEDFLRVPPSDMGSTKNNAYTNEETGLGVAFDFVPAEDGGETYIYLEFKSGIDFETEGDDEEGGNKPILGTKHLEEIKNAR